MRIVSAILCFVSRELGWFDWIAEVVGVLGCEANEAFFPLSAPTGLVSLVGLFTLHTFLHQSTGLLGDRQ